VIVPAVRRLIVIVAVVVVMLRIRPLHRLNHGRFAAIDEKNCANRKCSNQMH